MHAAGCYCDGDFLDGQVVEVEVDRRSVLQRKRVARRESHGVGIWGWDGVAAEPARDGALYGATSGTQVGSEDAGDSIKLLSFDFGLRITAANRPPSVAARSARRRSQRRPSPRPGPRHLLGRARARVRPGRVGVPAMDALLMAASFVLIVAGAIGFTNAVEWLGHRLDLGGGATGAILAAVGTALPESTIPVLALLGGGGQEAEEIAIGSIIGAPFLLGTLAMLMIGGAAMTFEGREDRPQGREIDAEQRTALRDLTFFAGGFAIALTLGVVEAPKAVRVVGAILLVLAYLFYAYRTIVKSRGGSGDEEDLDALFFDFSKKDPPNVAQIVLQFVVSLAAIIAGAEMFVQVVEDVAESLGVETLVLALILAPLATELPEKANSILWVRRGKDTLAVGNVSGAMTFQATLPVAIGLIATPWDLSGPAFVAGLCGLGGGLVAMLAIRSRHFGPLPCTAWGALLAFGVGYAILS